MSTADSASHRRTAAQRALSMMRLSARKILEPLLKPAAQDAVQAVEFDLSLSSAIKVSARNMLVGYKAFSDAFFAALDREMQSAVDDLLADRDNAAEQAGPRGRLSLVEYEQMEEQTVAIRVATRLRNAADLEYASLTRRIARAVRMPGLGDRDNPFHPLRYCRALGDAVDKLGFKADERHTILKAFEVPLRKPLADVYAHLNAKLEAQGVTDEEAARYNAVKTARAAAPGKAREPQPSAPPPAKADEAAPAETTPAADRMQAAAPRIAAAPAVASGPASGTSVEQLLAALFQRMQLKRAASASAAVTTVAPPVLSDPNELLGPTTRGFAGVPPAPALRRTEAAGSGARKVTGVPVQFAGIDPALLTSINEVQRLNALASMTARTSTARALLARDEQRHRQQVADNATRPIDKLTVELVGMVFDRIQRDDAVPAAIKGALSRLQFPVMKVALADTDLFVSPSMPARRLMDRIAGTSVGWHPEGEQNTRYLEQVNKAINTVLLAINEGPAIFEKSLQEFEAFLAEERDRDDEPMARARQAIEEAEQREAMATSAAAGLRRAFDGVQVDAYLREFLLDVWVKVLVAAGLRERAEPGLARRYQDAASDLIWSVQPKLDPDDRKRLVKSIPAVLNTLREGLQLIDVPFSSMRPFFTQLMVSHAQATKAGELAAAGAVAVDATAIRSKLDTVSIELMPDEDTQEPRELAAQMLRAAVAAHQADINVVEEAAKPLPDDPCATGLSDAEVDATIDSWQRGSWFDLWTGDGTERVQLRWVSPRRHFYLFTAAANGRAHSIAPAILRGYVRLGRIAPAEKAPLFERVVDDLLHDLQSEESALAV